MTYMVVVYNDGLQASDVEEALVGDTIGDHIAAVDGISIYGHPLQPPATARTVRVRDGLTLVSDGPFAETKEHIAGFDLLDCDSRGQAVALAATHPLAWFNKLEVRPLAEPVDWTAELRERLEQGPGVGKQRYMLLICSDGIATDAKTEVMGRELPRWVDQVTVSGARLIGCVLEAPEAGVMVRVRGPHTLTSNEPFAADPAEFLAGFNIIDCGDIEEAIAIAAAHPVAKLHAIEVRPFTPGMCNEPAAAEVPAEASVGFRPA
jgi:hypothetical protein